MYLAGRKAELVAKCSLKNFMILGNRSVKISCFLSKLRIRRLNGANPTKLRINKCFLRIEEGAMVVYETTHGFAHFYLCCIKYIVN